MEARMKRVSAYFRGNLRLAAGRLRGGAPAQADERTTLQRIAVAATVLVFSLVLPTVDTPWRLQAPEPISTTVGTGPALAPGADPGPDLGAGSGRAPRHRDLILGSGVRAAMSRMTTGY